MKKWLVIVIVSIIPFMSCSLFQNPITMDKLITEKEKIDNTDNPARKLLLKNELREPGYLFKNVIVLNDVLVKNVIPSTNIDYDFCVISDVRTQKGMVECYIYTRNLSKIANLIKGKTRIDVEGQFGRFFTLLDEYYTKVEIIKASIRIHEKD